MAVGARYPLHSLITMALVVINFCGFIVMLGGAAGLQSDATTVASLLNQVNQGPGAVLAFGDLFPVNTQGNFISYQWFKACFQAVTMLLALGVLATGQIYRFRLALIGLFAALAVLLSDSCNTFYYLFLQTKNNALVPNKIKKEVQVYWSGCIICATLNYIQIMTLGAGLEGGHHTHTGTGAATGPTGIKESNGATTPAV